MSQVNFNHQMPMSDFDRDAFLKRRDHRMHTSGSPHSADWNPYMGMPGSFQRRFGQRMPYVGRMDMAWTVMLFKQGLVEEDTARRLLEVLPETQQEGGWGGEEWLKKKLDGDEDTASAVNYGRTLQEPMHRMQMRDALLEVFDEAHDALADLLDMAELHAESMMAGQSHFSHAQPTTYGAYLLAVHEGLFRGLKQLELAYTETNRNSGGCGACSGTGWPVDRDMITDLLGFDGTIELAYDCEASQDEIPQILFALSSLTLTLSRSAMDHSIWALEEMGMIEVAPEWQGLSSFMPQKAHSGMFENVRVACDEVIGEMMKTAITYKGESIQDVLTVFKAPKYVHSSTGWTVQALGFFRRLVRSATVHTTRMEQIVRDGYSGAPDLAILLIREKNYGGRQAHRICSNFVRLARERGIHPSHTTAALLDEAAGVTEEPAPHLTDEQVRSAMTFERFFETHCNKGDPCPSETRRMVAERREQLDALRQAQTQRREKLRYADRRLEAEVQRITGRRTPVFAAAEDGASAETSK
ncbi:MAG: lyase family protein [Phycisphaeraceae bacterium]